MNAKSKFCIVLYPINAMKCHGDAEPRSSDFRIWPLEFKSIPLRGTKTTDPWLVDAAT